MNIFKRISNFTARFLRGIQVYTLVGKAGTGKSFRAQLIAKKYDINLIIDDGLLIKDQRIIAGKSAKQAEGAYTAIKTALFDEPAHRESVKKVLKKEKFNKILILGTSEKMVQRIARKLDLPPPARTIKIEHVATEREIQIARQARNHEGKHIIPVPAVEIKNMNSKIFFNAVKIFFKKRFGLLNKHEVFEKSIVQPMYTTKGKVTISKEALTQLILHCVDEFNPNLIVKKVILIPYNMQYEISIIIDVPYRSQISNQLYDLQTYILESIEKFTGIIVKKVNINIGAFS